MATEISSLELMLLVFVSEGTNTPYGLKLAGLSIGSTQPALSRLIDRGLLKKGEAGARGRMEYRITKAGGRVISKELPLIAGRVNRQQPMEELLRICALGIYSGKSNDIASVLKETSVRRQKVGSPKYPAKHDLAQIHSWLRALVEGRVRQAESEALAQVSSALSRRSK